MVNNMAKKKKSKDSESKSFSYSVELTGLILILIGIIGFGFGPVGSIIKKFSMFLVGGWAWIFLLLVVAILGVYMLIKRKMPKFFSTKMLGFYIICLILLVASHFGFIEKCADAKEIFQVTFDNYMDRISSISGTTALFTSGTSTIEIGGGIIGATFAVAFSSLFGITGTKIVMFVLLLFGFILFFNITFSDMLTKIKNFLRKFSLKRKDKVKKEFNADTLEYDTEEKKKDDKIIITSVEELKTNMVKEAPVVEAQDNTNADYRLPSLALLEEPIQNKKTNSNNFTRANKETLERVLNDFQIKGQVVEIHIGPAVTQYEVVVPAGTKVSRILSINKEIALALAAKDVRIQAPIPGKSTIGVEIPNPNISMVKIKEVLGSRDFEQKGAKILVALGKDIMGRTQGMDISKTPHLLVAGSTGSGKSVCINTMLASILMRYRPDEVKLMLVDPKKVELSNYNGVPHLLCPVVTDPKKASIMLQKIVAEMEDRYNMFSDKGVKNIGTYNEWVEKENSKHPETPIKKMPYIVVIIDELADLMLVASKEVEDSIMRITQMARAAGIHLIVATQRPSTDVITGVVKANIPSRISFAVASQIDSRTILDMPGAEKLLGKGDMLFLPMGENVPIRIQGCFISDNEIAKVIDYCCKEQMAKYDEKMTANVDNQPVTPGADKENYDDPMYNEVVEFAIQTGKISASLIQRRFRFGYNRAARIIDLLEDRGIVGPQNGSKPREVLVKLQEEENDE